MLGQGRLRGRPPSRLSLARLAAGCLAAGSMAAGCVATGGVGDAEALLPSSPFLPAGALTLVALGDSVPAGSACGCRPFPAQAARALGPRAVARNLAHGGLTSRGLLAQLSDPRTRAELARARAVTVTVGANDFDESRADDARCADPQACFAEGLDDLEQTIGRVLGRLGAVVRPGTAVLVTGYWNVFRDGRVGADHGPGYVAASAALTRQVNARLATAADTAGASYVDLYGPFAGSGNVTRLLARDGDHPNARGHRLIADQLVPLLERAAG